MYTFKLVSVSAIFLLVLVQGVVSQVPLGGSCETIVGFVCIDTMQIFMLLTNRYSIFNRNLVPRV
ncbi:hypothetical protein B0H13DRAFT_2006219 [Mycena leptocephala]|nr:hypothetical protein B0H13DRAFT_2079130 [Mycena leptocephala]KAJ7912690.1 hypothetical protein B0H13DRAFT_2006219 [Mycena leptocephala]